MTIRARPAKPSVRRRTGTVPAAAITGRRRWSRFARKARPSAISASVERTRIRSIEHRERDVAGGGCRVKARLPAPRQDCYVGVTRRAEPAMPRLVFRFAPSPNGLLHLGHAYSA